MENNCRDQELLLKTLKELCLLPAPLREDNNPFIDGIS